MKIYLASSWRNLNYPLALHMLQDAGHEVHDCRLNALPWNSIDKHWQSWNAKQTRGALQHRIAQDGFRENLEGMKWAEVGVLLLPCEAAHLELGWMAGEGKKTIIWTNDYEEPDLMFLLATQICVSQDEVLAALEVFGCAPIAG